VITALFVAPLLIPPAVLIWWYVRERQRIVAHARKWRASVWRQIPRSKP
jgi:hypothetical protein